MKGILVTMSVCAGIFFTSCKKERTCECQSKTTTTYSPETTWYKKSEVVNPSTTVYKELRKSEAEKLCIDFETTSVNTFTYSDTLITVTQNQVKTCEIK